MRLDMPSIAARSRSSAPPESSARPGTLARRARPVAGEPGAAVERVAALTERLLTRWEQATGRRLVAVLLVAEDSAADRAGPEPRTGASRRRARNPDGAGAERPARARRPLSAQQLAVARLVAAGCTNAEIGERLGIRTSTARNYVAAILERLGVPSRGAIGARLAADG